MSGRAKDTGGTANPLRQYIAMSDTAKPIGRYIKMCYSIASRTIHLNERTVKSVGWYI